MPNSASVAVWAFSRCIDIRTIQPKASTVSGISVALSALSALSDLPASFERASCRSRAARVPAIRVGVVTGPLAAAASEFLPRSRQWPRNASIVARLTGSVRCLRRLAMVVKVQTLGRDCADLGNGSDSNSGGADFIIDEFPSMRRSAMPRARILGGRRDRLLGADAPAEPRSIRHVAGRDCSPRVTMYSAHSPLSRDSQIDGTL